MKMVGWTSAVVLFVAVLAIGIDPIKPVSTITARVNSLERVTVSNGETVSSKWLVLTDVGAFENTDSLYFGKWDSSEIQASLVEGEFYSFKVVGWRIPFLSVYRNILSVSPVE